MLIISLKFKPVLNKLKYISLWGILWGILVACQPSQISIEQISAKKVGKTVYVTGKVIHLAPFVDNSAYQLEDTTGRIWVVTSNQAPQLGEKIKIKGKIEYQSLPFAERDLGDFYLIELDERFPIVGRQEEDNELAPSIKK